MNLLLSPLDSPGIFDTVAAWLAREENHRWLDFGDGAPLITPALLKIMARRETHLLRVFGSRDAPIGVVGLNAVNRSFRSGTLWGATGDKSFRSRGYGTRAASQFLTLAFREYGFHSINTWVVDGNPSRRIIERLGFRLVGRQRQSHVIGGRHCDRLIFDLLASEHRERSARPQGRLVGA